MTNRSVVPYEVEDKWRKVIELSAAIDRLRRQKHYTPDDALALQRLQQQRRELRALLPGIRVVVDNTA